MDNDPFVPSQAINILLHSSNESMPSPFLPIGNIVIVVFFFAQPMINVGATGASNVAEEDNTAGGVGGV